MKRLLDSATGAIAALCLSSAVPAMSATLLVDGSGKLTGASGVVVEGSNYDVTFLDGTCTSLFNGCDDNTDFAFTTDATVTAAAQALLDQVFIDGFLGNFDSRPALTSGCEDPAGCLAWIPRPIDRLGVFATGAYNSYTIGGTDVVVYSGNVFPFDTTSRTNQTWARFSVAVAPSVPEPSTWAMMLLGFGAAGIALRRRRKSVRIFKQAG